MLTNSAMANQDIIYSHVLNNPSLLPGLFAYKDVAGIARIILKSTLPGVDYAVLKFLQEYCVPSDAFKDAAFFIGDPRKYENLTALKKSWLFVIKGDSQDDKKWRKLNQLPVAVRLLVSAR